MNFIKNFRQHIYIYVAIGLYLFFAWISSLVPLVGDDWGYYINGLKGPVTMTLEFYQIWSGRIIGEFLGFLLAANAEWWMYVFNPLLFSLTFLLLYKIINPTSRRSLIIGVILFLMFTVSHGIRMQTFTFVVGSINFRFSAVMAMIQLCLIGRYLDNPKTKFKSYEVAISIIAGVTVGLIMENIAGCLILANLLLIGYRLIYVKRIDIILLCNIVATTCAFLIMRGSPGSQARLMEHPEWLTKNLLEKISMNYSDFIQYTFTENRFVISALVVTMAIFVFQKRAQFKCSVLAPIISLILLSPFYVFSAPFIVSLNEADGTSFWKVTSYAYYFIDKNSWILMGYWTLIAILLFAIMVYFIRLYKTLIIATFYYILAMAVMGAMMLSPVIGPRCAIFTVYFLIIVIGYLIKEVKIPSSLAHLITLIFVGITLLTFNWYGRIYSEVSRVHQEQEKLIEQYKKNPTGDLYLPAYPIYSIHSGQAETLYHQEVFKKFYGLDESVKIHYR